jgi:hypothetical protein
MTPKQVFDAAQAAGMDMTYVGIRKLMRDMLRRDLRCDKGHYSLIASLSEKEINAAPKKEFYQELITLIESHRRQRRTTGADFIPGLEKALSEERVKFTRHSR